MYHSTQYVFVALVQIDGVGTWLASPNIPVTCVLPVCGIPVC